MPEHTPGDDTVNRQPAPSAEPPRAEPEIIPPGIHTPSRPHYGTFAFAHHETRIRIARPGPFGVAMLIIGAAALGAIGTLLLLGALLIGAAAMGVVIVAALVSHLLRGAARR